MTYPLPPENSLPSLFTFSYGNCNQLKAAH
jgi:hypothetical protein